MRFDVLTLFPEAIGPYVQSSILRRGQEAGAIDVRLTNIRDFAPDKHKTVDDTPYGGGAGMVLKIEPIGKALAAAKAESGIRNQELRKIVVLSARGKQFTQEKAKEYAQLDQLILVCGRYEGIDQRVADHLADEEISIGPYVLAGGELGALTILEATARLVPGVLGNEGSLGQESHNKPGFIEAPQYTKPEEYNGWNVPEVLLSGNHTEIEKWRHKNSK